MKKSRIGLIAAALLSVASHAYAQTAPTPKITFSAAVTSGVNTVTPALTWSTSPVADSCTASGASDWSGPKAAQGSVTLNPISSSVNYSLACTWKGGQATLTWVNATKNTDGSDYTNPLTTRIYYGRAADTLDKTIDIPLPSPPLNSRIMTSLSPEGMWYFAVATVNSDGKPSDKSNVAGKYVLASDVNVTQVVGITVYKQPAAPTGLTVQ